MELYNEENKLTRLISQEKPNHSYTGTVGENNSILVQYVIEGFSTDYLSLKKNHTDGIMTFSKMDFKKVKSDFR